MKVAYVDTSCLVAVTFGESGGVALTRRLRSFDELVSANLLEAEHGNLISIEERLQRFYAALRSARCSVALVSNEVGSGIVPPFPAGRTYRDLLGEINQRVASAADNVLLMVAGLPLALKGTAEVLS